VEGDTAVRDGNSGPSYSFRHEKLVYFGPEFGAKLPIHEA